MSDATTNQNNDDAIVAVCVFGLIFLCAIWTTHLFIVAKSTQHVAVEAIHSEPLLTAPGARVEAVKTTYDGRGDEPQLTHVISFDNINTPRVLTCTESQPAAIDGVSVRELAVGRLASVCEALEKSYRLRFGFDFENLFD